MEEAWSEIEALRSIFETELIVEEKQNTINVSKKVRPVDYGNGPTASVVCQFLLKEGYPEITPEVTLNRPRGLSDKDFHDLNREVQEKVKESAGLLIIFDILQLCSDFFLTHQNSTELLCPICLCALSTEPVICTSSCDHYLHSACMNEHILVSRRGIAAELQNPETRALRKEVDKTLYCPVCREMIEEEIEPLYEENKAQTSKKKDKGYADFTFDWKKWRKEQEKLTKIYEKQQKQGGIIDLEAERQKNLITEDTVVEIPLPVEEPIAAPPDQQIEEPPSNQNKPYKYRKEIRENEKKPNRNRNYGKKPNVQKPISTASSSGSIAK